MKKRLYVVVGSLLLVGILFSVIWASNVVQAQADMDVETAIAAFSLNGGDPWRVYSPQCFDLGGETVRLELRIHSGSAATNGRYSEESGWVTAVALGTGAKVIPSWQGWNICFGEDAYADLVSLDPEAGENPLEGWSLETVTETLEVTISGPKTVVLGESALYTATVTGGGDPLGFIWNPGDCGGEVCHITWDTPGDKLVEVDVEGIWGAWAFDAFATEVVEPALDPTPTPDPTPEPTPDEEYLVFLPLVVSPPVVCQEPSETQVSFAGSTWQGAAGGCITLGGSSGTLEVETALWFAGNGRKTASDPWTNAVAGPGFYEFEWEGFLLCFGETEEEALSVLTSADPNSASNPTWYPDAICIPE